MESVRYLALLLVLASSTASSALIQVDVDGQLVGASGVEVNGELFDVEFVEGSCVTLFNGCDSDLFAFRTSDDAIAAGNALLSQVFIDSLSLFDTNPSLTLGCDRDSSCRVEIPFALTNPAFLLGAPQSIRVASVTNEAIEFSDRVFATPETITAFATVDNTGASSTFARFTQATAVPEPGMFAFVAVGLLGLAWRRCVST